MTDRGLLEAAAKAAGVALRPSEVKNVTRQGDDRFIGYMTDPEEWPRGWFDPLTNDGDAMRLAVKLGVVISPWGGTIYVNKAGAKPVDARENFGPNGDPYAATRRAIVRAAAAMTI
jgi:hypothetical protein